MRRSKPHSTEQGLTLIESLAAIVIFGVAVVAISPPIVLSMAARVRAHRAEQALNLAQGEIERVRLLVEQGRKSSEKTLTITEFTNLLPPKGTNLNVVPTSFENCGASPVASASTTGCTVDIDRNGIIEKMDFVVQSFRTASQCQGDNNDVPVGLNMVVRVYTVASVEAYPGSLVPKQGSLAFSGLTTSGPTPLAVLDIPIVRSDLGSSSLAYQNLLNGNGNCP
ncbi:type IV pilus modification PilV family protein [Laspinema olomoucense]|uniref:type IV pilus modification PilV family protein n=1 Tax=Laspinema olomoucense TaxID=3231600 RepID=UPI0021BA8E0B|nr:type II secretion system protein [Laspinema sp. D3a]MCT7988540.1 type II secretion system GspH family protein [Laspinema sp. D3a]